MLQASCSAELCNSLMARLGRLVVVRYELLGARLNAGFCMGICLCVCLASWSTPELPAQDRPLATIIEQFSADQQTLVRRYQVPLDPEALEKREDNLRQWQQQLAELDFAQLDRAGQIDYVLLRREIEYRLKKQALDQQRDADARTYVPYAQPLLDFLKSRENVDNIDPSQVASQLDQAAASVEQLTQLLPTTPDSTSALPTEDRLRALRATELQRQLLASLNESHEFYAGYDPLYSWWVSKPMERIQTAIEQHRIALRQHVVGVPDEDQETIIGLPIGEAGLRLELDHEWIVHEPAELVQLAERELAWCDAQMVQAAAELGCGDDWRKAMELVKAKYVQPGEQPQLIRELAWESIRFLETHDLLTVPPLAAQGWTMSMMSPERQRLNPYFLGGDSIIVSFPTDAMTHEEKLMSMRSNNEHFARATVHHELIPGHHLQYYMLPRHHPYRKLFATPFWMEGWALYWEMQFWDLGFAHGAEDRVGMLFWRKHRCARIIFSLNYHLGTMSPEECIDYLVNRVGHERSAAAAEVRRSIMGGYSPLYQAAYMLGGLQLRSLHRELVLSGKLTNRQFHDAVLHEHSIPIEVLRAALTDAPWSRDQRPTWRFADEVSR